MHLVALLVQLVPFSRLPRPSVNPPAFQLVKLINFADYGKLLDAL